MAAFTAWIRPCSMGNIARTTRSMRMAPVAVGFLGVSGVLLIVFSTVTDLRSHNHHMIISVAHSVSRSNQIAYTSKESAMDPSANSVQPIKELVKEGLEKGLIIIVNTTETDANAVFAMSGHRSSPQWDINGALDGSTGELLAEVMQELYNVEELQKELASSDSGRNSAVKEVEFKAQEKKKNPHSMSEWDYKFQTYGQALHPLVVFSAYRFSNEAFFVVALVAATLQEKTAPTDPTPNMCAWMARTGSPEQAPVFPLSPSPSHKHPQIQLGSKSVVIVNDPHGGPYDVAVIKCVFEDPAGANGHGGHLYLKLATGSFVPVFDERPEAINRIQFEGHRKYKYAYCSPPIWAKLNAEYLKQWFMYHHHLFHDGKVHYFIYHGGQLDAETMKVLRPLLDRGLLTLVNISSNKSKMFEGQYPSHHLAINDCLHRVRFLADWVFFWDLDEYLSISAPYSVSAMLESHKDSPWISFGNMIWSNTYCSPQQNSSVGEMWAIDRMYFRLEHPTCGEKERAPTCYGVEGQRTWLANPRRVFAGSTHLSLDPQWNGVTLDTGAARVNHYIGLLTPDSNKDNCRVIKVPEEIEGTVAMDGWWWKDLSISETTQSAHAFASSSRIFNSSYINPSPLAPEVPARNKTAQESLQ